MSNHGTCCSCPETLAMASVPRQEWCEPYDLETALREGTVFPFSKNCSSAVWIF